MAEVKKLDFNAPPPLTEEAQANPDLLSTCERVWGWEYSKEEHTGILTTCNAATV
jgi:hypothetical protein